MADDWKWTNQVRPGTCKLCRHIVGGARTISAKSYWLLLLEATFPQSASLFHKQKLIEIKHSFITAHVHKPVSVNQNFIFIVFSLYRDWIVCKSQCKSCFNAKNGLRFEHCCVGRNRFNQWFWLSRSSVSEWNKTTDCECLVCYCASSGISEHTLHSILFRKKIFL